MELGADLAIQSGTKYIGGHSDVLLGVVTTDQPELYEKLLRVRQLFGGSPSEIQY